MDPWTDSTPINIMPVQEEVGPTADIVDPRLPQPPFRWGVVGSSGSGKSVLLSNLLSQADLYRSVFDRIYVFSPTAKSDPAWTVLGLALGLPAGDLALDSHFTDPRPLLRRKGLLPYGADG